MKKTVWFGIVVFSLFLMGCGDVLTVVTVNENGEKVIHSYISLIDDTVYDSTVTLQNWRDAEHIKNDDSLSDNLLFTIVNKKENIVVLGDANAAIEISFFNGGYKYTLYMSADDVSKATDDFSKGFDDLSDSLSEATDGFSKAVDDFSKATDDFFRGFGF